MSSGGSGGLGRDTWGGNVGQRSVRTGRWLGTIVAVGVVWAWMSGAVAHAQVNRDEALVTKLKELAAPLVVKDVISIDGRPQSGGQITWDVWYDGGRILAHLDQEKIAMAEPERARVIAWYRDLNGKLLKAAARGMALARPGNSFDTETDVSCEFTSTGNLAEDGRVGSQECTFRGSRITYIERPADGTTTMDPVGPAVKGVGAEVEIVPDKLIYAPGETVAGRYEIYNRGKRRITIAYDGLPRVTVLTAGGKPAPTFSAGGGMCGGCFTPPPVIIEPGMSYEGRFDIETDPLGSRSGIVMEPGRYRLMYPDLAQRFNIPTKTRPVTIEVRAKPGEALGSRIIDFVVGDGRITVLREGGDVDSYDAATAAHVSGAKLEGFSLERRWMNFLLGPTKCAIGVGPWNDGYPTRLTVYNLVGPSSTKKTLDLPKPADRMEAQVHLQHFSDDGRAVMLLQGDDWYAFDITGFASGTTAERADGYAEASPGGDYLVRSEDEVPIATPRGGGPAVALTPPGAPSATNRLLGRRGVYMASEKAAKAVWAAYDGSSQVEFPTKAEFTVCESDDGRYVVFASVSPFSYSWKHEVGFLEVWDTTGPSRLCEIKDGKARSAAFCGDKLVCAVRNLRAGQDSSWYSPTFEVRDISTGKVEREIALAAP